MSSPPATFGPSDVRRLTRRLTLPLSKVAAPPSQVEVHVGKGYHLLLRGGGQRFLHVTILAGRALPRDPFSTEFTSLSFSSAGEPSREERRWLLALVRGVRLLERDTEWPAFLAWAASQPAVMLPDASFDPNLDPASGNLECIRVETRCNGRCPFCSARGVLPDLVLDDGVILERLRAMRAAGRQQVAFTGGEPTLRRDLPSLVAQARQEGFTDITLQTNALQLAQGPLLPRLVDAGVTAVFVPLLSHEALTHDELIGVPGAFERTVSAIDRCLSLGLKVSFNTVLTRLNLEHLEPLVAWLPERFPSTRITGNISFVALQGWALDHLDLVPRLTDARPHLRAALDTCARLGLEITIPGICGVPICQLPGYEPFFDEYRCGFQGIPSNRRYARACDDCPYRDRCSGFWAAYLDHFGEAELGYRGGRRAGFDAL